METTLIAGSNGIIGSQLFSYLNIDNNVFGIGYEDVSQKNYSQLDLTDKKKVSDFIKNNERFSTLVFLTGLAHAKGKGAEYNKFYTVNVQTLMNLLGEMKNQNKLPGKIIFSSTVSTYGERYKQAEYHEDSELNPKSPYAITKLEAENYLLENFKELSWILRFAPVYTPEFLLNISRRTIFKNRFFRVGDGNNKLSLLSIKNIEKVIESIIDNKVPAGLYNVCDEKEYTFNDLLKFSAAKSIMYIPKYFIKSIYYINKILKNTFINENSIKLLTDNLYPSTKLQKFIKLDNSLWDMKKL
ncbi:MAG: NAD(P)-dependent oxidoreductase [Melioribacteraceae bacterium]